MDRQPVVAGQFYPASDKALAAEVARHLEADQGSPPRPTLLAMVPHAGYVYSGSVAGLTLARADLAKSILLMGPNHTGLGAPMALWSEGRWLVPGGGLDVDQELCRALLAAEPRIQSDTKAHLREHSLEVVVPFLRAMAPDCRVAPLAVAEQRLEALLSMAQNVAKALREHPEPVSMVVSSDMTHFLSHDQATAQDRLALDRIEHLDPEGLFTTVRRKNITMCGVLPMTLGLAVCRELGADKAEITGYATSAAASGDYSRVVGYGGALVHRPEAA